MRAPLLVFFLAASAAAYATEFSTLDRNADGFVTRIEALADQEIHKRFGQFDANKDRQLSLAEYLAAREEIERRAQQDAALTARVRAALIAERDLPLTGITVETYEGGVQLSGFVPAPDLASRAGRVTAGVSGVRTVSNNLVVRQK
jgi:osmotically-inducible protein OsmY